MSSETVVEYTELVEQLSAAPGEALTTALQYSAAIALQDATEHLRRAEIIAEAATARALALDDPDATRAGIEAAAASVNGARANYVELAALAARMAEQAGDG
jgi:hypothetical protein